MTARSLKTAMTRHDKTVLNVASESELAVNTIKRFLKGKATHKGTAVILRLWLERIEGSTK